MHDIKIPAGAASIIDALATHGFEAYAVGGCVRDSLLGLTPNDWDICTDATPDRVKELLPFRTIDTGIQHGTVTVLCGGEQFEVTTFRVEEGYSDNRHPDRVRYVRNIHDDLARRDFTVNAMAYNDIRGLVDEFGGRDDLEKKVISCVGIPDERFSEDALRILRALRFASTYEFSIHPETTEAVHRNRARLSNIAAERIREEFLKLLCGRGVYRILSDFSDIICEIIPELSPCIGFSQNSRYHIFDVYDHITHAVENYHGNDIAIKLALLFHDIGKPHCYTEDEKGGHFYSHAKIGLDIAKRALLRLRLDNKTRLATEELILYHDTPIMPTEKSVKKWLSRIGEESLRRLIEVKRADILAQNPETVGERLSEFDKILALIDEIISAGECFSLSDLAIDGNGIIALGIPRGREVGKTLALLLDEVISGKLENQKETLEERVKKLKI